MNLATRLTALIALGLALTGCAGSPPEPTHTVVRTVHIDDPGPDSKVIIVHRQPAATRHCVRHRNHWHCKKQ